MRRGCVGIVWSGEDSKPGPGRRQSRCTKLTLQSMPWVHSRHVIDIELLWLPLSRAARRRVLVRRRSRMCSTTPVVGGCTPDHGDEEPRIPVPTGSSMVIHIHKETIDLSRCPAAGKSACPSDVATSTEPRSYRRLRIEALGGTSPSKAASATTPSRSPDPTRPRVTLFRLEQAAVRREPERCSRTGAGRLKFGSQTRRMMGDVTGGDGVRPGTTPGTWGT